MDLMTRRQQCLTETFNAYGNMLYRIALTHTGSREDAEDACQDVFIKFSLTDQVFTTEEHKKAWLVRVLINHCRDLIRKRKIRTHLSLEDIEQVISDTSLSGEYAELLSLVDSLPVKYREVIILHYLEGYSVEETAKLLSISVSGIKMRLMRAREMIKDNITKEE